MKCPACKTEVADGSIFCPKCGRSLVTPESAPSAARAAVEAPVASRDSGSTSPPQSRLAPTDPATAVNAVEEELWSGGYSPKAMLGTWILGAVISLGLVVCGFFIPGGKAWPLIGGGIVLLFAAIFLVMAYRRLTIGYRLTSQRFFQMRGFVRRRTDRIEVIKIDDITFEQGPIERFTGTGTIRVASADRSDPILTMRGIGEVSNVADLLDNARRAERRRRGLYMVGDSVGDAHHG